MRVKRQQPEYESQVLVIAWARQNQVKYPQLRLLFAVPNASRSPVQFRVKLKRQGLVSGIPDMIMSCPSGPYHSLMIELKAPQGRLSPEQKAIHPILQEYGNCVRVCYSAQEAIQTLVDYLTLPAVAHA